MFFKRKPEKSSSRPKYRIVRNGHNKYWAEELFIDDGPYCKYIKISDTLSDSAFAAKARLEATIERRRKSNEITIMETFDKL